MVCNAKDTKRAIQNHKRIVQKCTLRAAASTLLPGFALCVPTRTPPQTLARSQWHTRVIKLQTTEKCSMRNCCCVSRGAFVFCGYTGRASGIALPRSRHASVWSVPSCLMLSGSVVSWLTHRFNIWSVPSKLPPEALHRVI
jgi:hypothetical protein